MINLTANQALGYFAMADLGEPPLDPGNLFPAKRPVEVEIGAGRGDFAIQYGQQNPQINLLAIERKLVILRRAANKLRSAKAPNVAFLNGEARYLFENYFPPACIAALHIYFPDPWPKKRHAKRRIVQASNLEVFLRALKPDCPLYFRSDVEPYYLAAMEQFRAISRLKEFETPESVASVQTAYETRFIRHKKPIFRAAFRLE